MRKTSIALACAFISASALVLQIGCSQRVEESEAASADLAAHPGCDADGSTSDAGAGDASAPGHNPCAAGDGGTSGDGGDAGPPLASLVLLNELKINAPGDADGPWRYVEVACTPGASLAGHSLVV